MNLHDHLPTNKTRLLLSGNANLAVIHLGMCKSGLGIQCLIAFPCYNSVLGLSSSLGFFFAAFIFNTLTGTTKQVLCITQADQATIKGLAYLHHFYFLQNYV